MHLLIPLLLLLLSHSPTPSLALNQEGLYLLTAKSLLDDPSHSLSNWHARDATPCSWTGISCSPTGAVTSIDLSDVNLFGPFPEVLCRLDNLTHIDLSINSINSTLPSLLRCNSLSHLNLSQNLLTGLLPSSLSSLPSLIYLDLSGNNFTGAIPPSFSLFPSLQILSLTANLLNETIPPFLGNISTLRQLNLSYNPFIPGPVPAEIGNLSNLEVLWLTECNLVGPIPDSLGSLSKLQDLDLSFNKLTGRIPQSLTRLSSVIQIELYNNSLSGTIPSGFSSISTLLRIDASMNFLEGAIPDDVFQIKNLESLHLFQNNLTGNIPATLSYSQKLVELRLFGNRLNGSLPPDFGRNSSLMYVDLSDNMLSGAIPAGVCERGMLLDLLLIDNQFTGGLPEGLGKCQSLRRLRLAKNQLSGPIPDGLWGLPHISLLELISNSFTGGISPQISGAANLSKLLLSNNQFSGSIPSEIGMASNLYDFSADNNRLTGPLPAALADLAQLGQLSLRNNSLSGDLLSGIQSWTKLTELTLADNGFTGRIPQELGELPVMNYLDLSGNKLTGEIPLQLQNLKLNYFNLSNNQLSGPLPPLYASEAYRDSFLGNPGLCGDLADLCPTSQDHASDHHGFFWLLRSIFIFAALVLIIGLAWFYLRYRNFKKAKLGMDKSKWILTSFHKLGFSEYEILDCLDEDNVIGSGASGRVYKAVLSNGEAVAVKKLWGPSNKSGENYDKASNDAFEAEVTTLGKVRHKNIVKLWCSCTHKDCKLLVYEYMPNGSLGDLLHSSKGRLLDWPMRYKIALDAAEGLSYLHHDCVPPIVHRDVKSNNILLDEEFRARVADFGVAKAVEAIGKGPKSMSVIAGSCGYIAPEYAYTLRVNEKSDIYSFGVVILELVTGKPPVDPEFGEKDLAKWVCSTLDQKGLDHVIDPKLDSCYKEEICKVLNIGILCTSSLPINRPSMRRVVKMLLEVSPDDDNNNNKTKRPEMKDGKLPPYYDDSSEHGSIA